MRTYIISPLGTPEAELYSMACVRDCLNRGEAPFCWHLQFPGRAGDGSVRACLAWIDVSETVAAYCDLDVTPTMGQEKDAADALGHPVEVRRIGKNWRDLVPEGTAHHQAAEKIAAFWGTEGR